jgi:isopropylmalate/homocitrate/citramalate synthase
VGEAVAEVVGIAAGENLRLIFETAKGAGVDDAVAVALEVVAVGMRWFREAASAGMFHLHRVAGQHGKSSR